MSRSSESGAAVLCSKGRQQQHHWEVGSWGRGESEIPTVSSVNWRTVLLGFKFTVKDKKELQNWKKKKKKYYTCDNVSPCSAAWEFLPIIISGKVLPWAALAFCWSCGAPGPHGHLHPARGHTLGHLDWAHSIRRYNSYWRIISKSASPHFGPDRKIMPQNTFKKKKKKATPRRESLRLHAPLTVIMGHHGRNSNKQELHYQTKPAEAWSLLCFSMRTCT